MPRPSRASVSRRVVLTSVLRRDATQRLSLAYCLLLRDLAERIGPVPDPEPDARYRAGLAPPQREGQS
jgi:hypothetical protein